MRGAPVAVRAQMNEILPEMRQALSRKRALVERTREKSQRENLSLDRVRTVSCLHTRYFPELAPAVQVALVFRQLGPLSLSCLLSLGLASQRSDDVNRQNLKAMGQLQAQSTERLENSRRQLSDIENVGGDIMIDLRRQRDVLTHSKANLEETDNWIASSGRVLRSMAQQTMCMSALWWFIVLVLLAIIGIIIYVKFIRTK